MITANYRLGLWGCLYLGGHNPDFADSANLEVLDQVMLLRWIRDNITGFGGDPGNVILFGMSSGGCDVATLLGTPAAHGLFRRAAIYSGNAEVPMFRGGRGAPPTRPILPQASWTSRELQAGPTTARITAWSNAAWARRPSAPGDTSQCRPGPCVRCA